jgi:hypothetical protein
MGLFVYCSVTWQAAGSNSSSALRVGRHTIGAHVRRAWARLKSTSEEPASGRQIPLLADQDVDELAEVVNRPIQLDPLPAGTNARPPRSRQAEPAPHESDCDGATRSGRRQSTHPARARHPSTQETDPVYRLARCPRPSPAAERECPTQGWWSQRSSLANPASSVVLGLDRSNRTRRGLIQR